MKRRVIPQRCNNVHSKHYAKQISHVKVCDVFSVWDIPVTSGEVKAP